MSYAKDITVSEEVEAEIRQITCTLPGKVYYSDDGEALILCDDGKYIISVEPPDPLFNDGNPATHSAYLVNLPPEEVTAADPLTADPEEYKGWTSGWEC
jgi:hypothetical protein